MNSEGSSAPAVESSLVESELNERSAKLADFGLFFRKFLSKGLTISSAVPSSKAMASALLRFVDFSKPSTIVELGAGTGAITELILERLRPHHRFVMVENDPDFCEVLRRRFPQTPLLQMSVEKVGEHLGAMGIHKVDYVISGLPTPNLPHRVSLMMWKWLGACLTPEGRFLQITVVPQLYRAFYDRLFTEVDYRMVWLNVPPGGVYLCSGPRRHLARKR